MKTLWGKLGTLLLLLASFSAHGNVTVKGIVTAQGSSKPLGGATVTVSSNCSPGSGCWNVQVVTTARDGHYSTANAAPGIIYVAAAYQPGQANYAPSEPQQLTATNGSTHVVNFALAAGVTIHGTVRAQSDGTPLASLSIQLESSDFGNIASTTTDASGAYVFTQLPVNAYVLKTWLVDNSLYQQQFYAGHALAAPSLGQPADVLTPAAGDSVTADFALVVGGRITATLIDGYSGQPVPAADITAEFIDTNVSYCCLDIERRAVHSDANGRFELKGLSDAPFHLSAYAATATNFFPERFYGCDRPSCEYDWHAVLTVPAGETQDIQLILDPNAKISGTVTRRSDGQPVAGVQVDAFGLGKFSFPLVYDSVSTDDQGHYTMNEAVAGSMLVGVFDNWYRTASYIDQVYNDQNCLFGSCAGHGQVIEVPESQEISGIDFQLDVGASISGNVVGATYPGARVYLYAGDGSLSAAVPADTSGHFISDGLQAGTYYIAASPVDSRQACTFYGQVPCECGTPGVCTTPTMATSGAQPIILGTSDVSNIQITVPISEVVFGNGFE